MPISIGLNGSSTNNTDLEKSVSKNRNNITDNVISISGVNSAIDTISSDLTDTNTAIGLKQDILNTDENLSLTDNTLSIINPNKWNTGMNSLSFNESVGIGTAAPQICKVYIFIIQQKSLHIYNTTNPRITIEDGEPTANQTYINFKTPLTDWSIGQYGGGSAGSFMIANSTSLADAFFQ